MNDDTSSETAEAAAALRALHYLYETQHILTDPFAIKLTSRKWKFILSNRVFPYLLKNTIMKPIYNAVGGQILSRGRYAEDKLKSSINRGIKQYVILGAGMDTFALRYPNLLDKIKVFEIDHPATQKKKKENLLKIVKTLPENLVFIPVNFEKQTVSDALSNTSFDPNSPTFFSWMGTSYYLTQKSIFETLTSLREIAATNSEIVFDYYINDELLTKEGLSEVNATKTFVAKRGEVFLTSFDHQELIQKVDDIEYELVELAPPEDIQKRYFQNRKDTLNAAQWCSMIHLKTKEKLHTC